MKPIVCVHLDLKGMLFRFSYLAQWMKDLTARGINAILVEYEDLFPFDNLDIAADTKSAWSRKQLRQFLQMADNAGLEVIPLQQCLGHLEYLLRWKKYRRFAEDPAYPSTIKQNNKQAEKLILHMLDQILIAHPKSRYVHLGMDEAHALVQSAQAAGQEPLSVFAAHLDVLCRAVEAAGKIPIIWSDMLEDHFCEEYILPFRERVVLAPWDYRVEDTRPQTYARLNGIRESKEWLKKPENPHAPPIGENTPFIEEMPEATAKLAAPFREGQGFRNLFLVDFWTKLGFRVMGAGALRSSSAGPVLPDFNHFIGNIHAWGAAIQRSGQLGLIGTSWARGTTFCPPGFCPDLTWPMIDELGRCMGAKTKAFWPGIAAERIDLLIRQAGRCARDWRLEGKLADEMATLAETLQAHTFEWESLRLMLQTLKLRRRAAFALEEVDFFHANIRPPEPEWRRRLTEQKACLKEIRQLRKQVRRHFRQRYRGDAFDEWCRDLFDLHEQRLRQAGEICREKMMRAAEFYRKH